MRTLARMGMSAGAREHGRNKGRAIARRTAGTGAFGATSAKTGPDPITRDSLAGAGYRMTRRSTGTSGRGISGPLSRSFLKPQPSRPAPIAPRAGLWGHVALRRIEK